MKKTMALLAILLAAMLAVAAALPFGVPSESVVSGPALLADGSQLAAENRQLVSRIYKLQNGTISRIYEESRYRNGQGSEIVRVAAAEDGFWYLRLYEDGVSWELMRQTGEGAACAYQGRFDAAMPITGLTVREGTAWITALGGNGAIHVYACENAQGVSLKLLIPAWWLKDVATAEFDGQVIRATTVHGDHCFLTPNGGKTYTDEAAEAPAPEITAESPAAWLLSKKTVFLGVLLLWTVIALSVLITSAVTGRAERLAARLTAVGGEVMFLMLLAFAGVMLYLLLPVVGVGKAVRTTAALAAGGGAVWLAGLLVMRVIAGRITKPAAALARQMVDVADGRVDFKEVLPGKDELHQIDQAMQEMCMSLSVRNYEIDSTVRSYERFVPAKLTELLERAAVAEVCLGDSCRSVSNIGLFSVGNRDEARNVLSDDAFVEFINHSFAIFQECVQENHGSMISSGLRLSAMETMFPDSAVDGVRAGLDFLGRAQKKTAEHIPAPKPLLVLHQASFLYGVAGREDRLFPYLSSGEMEFLGSYASKFHKIGVRMVMTEQYWEQIKDHSYDARYIGFVSDGDKTTYKLYEVLDAYPELEKKLRVGYDQRFQEAINLFYRNDFFLARNLFSTLLRVCPEDGVVRWYLFACEYFFNQTDTYEADYRLFGVEEI